jgi:hypothetical protein
LFAHGNRQLDNPLGKWLYTPENQRMAWPFYYDPIGSTFYRRNNDTFLAYLGNGRKHPNTTPITTTNLPETSVPVDVALPPNTAKDVPAAIDTIRTWQLRHKAIQQVTPTTAPTPDTFYEYIGNLDPWEQTLLENLEWDNTYQDTANIISTQPFLVASDGASDPATGMAAFGWILADANGKTLIKCAGPVYGLTPSSYRAEAYGVLSPTRMIYHLLSYHQLQNLHPYIHYCDNKSIVGHTEHCMDHKDWYPNDCLKSDWDVLQQITESFKTALLVPAVEHVKSHQDNNKEYDKLPLKAQLNCQADWAAGEPCQFSVAPTVTETVHYYGANFTR